MQDAFVFGGRPLVAPTKSRWSQCAKSGWNLRIAMVYRLLENAPIFNGLFADSVVGATTGRPPSSIAQTKPRRHGSLAVAHADRSAICAIRLTSDLISKKLLEIYLNILTQLD